MRNGPTLHLAPKPHHLASHSLGAKAKDKGLEGKQQHITSQCCICVFVCFSAPVNSSVSGRKGSFQLKWVTSHPLDALTLT